MFSRWCAKTHTPKTHNMMVPTFSRRGSILILQIRPIEGSVNMDLRKPSAQCVAEGFGYVKKVSADAITVNETDIHYDEFVIRSDERGK